MVVVQLHRIGTNVPEVMQVVETVLNLAVRQKEIVELIYLDRKGRLTQRRVRVLGLGEEEIRVYCWKRRAFRRLRREGILAAARKPLKTQS